MAIEGYSSLKGMPLAPEDLHTIRTGLTATSQIQRVSPAIPNFKLEGLQEYNVGEVEARVTGEGEAKIASGSATSVVFKPEKFTAAVVETLEASIARPEIAEGLISTAGTAFAKKYDRLILGLDTATLNPYFGTLTGLSVVPVAEYGDFLDAESEVELAGGNASALILTSAAFNVLRRQKDAAGWVFPGLQDRTAPDIDGIPVYRVVDSRIKAVLGDFAGHSKHGVAIPEFMQVKNQGNITDNLGQVHNLTDSNKIATIVETFLGFNYDDKKYFVELDLSAYVPTV